MICPVSIAPSIHPFNSFCGLFLYVFRTWVLISIGVQHAQRRHPSRPVHSAVPLAPKSRPTTHRDPLSDLIGFLSSPESFGCQSFSQHQQSESGATAVVDFLRYFLRYFLPFHLPQSPLSTPLAQSPGISPPLTGRISAGRPPPWPLISRRDGVTTARARIRTASTSTSA